MHSVITEVVHDVDFVVDGATVVVLGGVMIVGMPATDVNCAANTRPLKRIDLENDMVFSVG